MFFQNTYICIWINSFGNLKSRFQVFEILLQFFSFKHVNIYVMNILLRFIFWIEFVFIVKIISKILKNDVILGIFVSIF
jgi:hypothetical protein